jgi:hypothetical protein
MGADRPLLGHKEWTGDVVSGVFYVALDPEEWDFVEKEDFNAGQDATTLEYITQQEVVDEMIFYYEAHPSLWKRMRYHDFTNLDIQKELVATWYNLELNWRE